MSAPLRFLGFAVFAWVGVRAASLGLFPGVTALVPPASASPGTAEPGRSTPAAYDQQAYPPAAQAYPPYPTYQTYPSPAAPYPPYGYAPYPAAPAGYGYPYPPQVLAVPDYGGRTRVVYAAYPPPPPPTNWVLPPEGYVPPYDRRMAEAGYSQTPPLDGRPSRGGGGLQSTPPPVGPAKLDRWQLSAWTLLRNRPGAPGLASGGTLGGNQAGARITYKFTPQLAASLRFSSGLGGLLGAEVAGGVRWQPMRSVPVAVTIERRHGLGRYGGRDAFALFAEGGVYNRRIVGSWRLDAYAQGGVVGAKNRDLFADGAASLTRPLWRNMSGGIAVWGGVQPGVYRVDAGPRLTLDMGRGIKVHADYRQRLLGNAYPPSGPALTIAGDF